MVSLVVQETLTSICSHRLAYSFIKIILCDVEGKDRHSPFIFFTHIFLALLLSCFSRVRLCAAPEMAAHQAPPFPGFSRQEYWSGLPFPSPMHESEKWKWSCSVVSDSSRPHGLQPTRLLCPWDLPGKSTGVGCHCLLWDVILRTLYNLNQLWLLYNH